MARRSLAVLPVLVVLAFAGCGGDDEEESGSAETGAAGIETVTSNLEDAGYTVEQLPADQVEASGELAPDTAFTVTGGELSGKAFAYVEEYPSEEDAAKKETGYQGQGYPYVIDGSITYWGPPPLTQADVDAIAEAGGLTP